MNLWCSFATLVLFMLVFAIGGDLIPICNADQQMQMDHPTSSDCILYLIPQDSDELTEAFEGEEESQIIVSAAHMLPQGWQWQDYDDGSGGLYSPDGKSYISYDLAPYFNQGGIEYQNHSSCAGWRVFWGSLEEFRSFCERWISSEVIAR